MAVSSGVNDYGAAAFHARMIDSAEIDANRWMDEGGTYKLAMAKGRLDCEMNRLGLVAARGEDVKADIARISACYERLKALQPSTPIMMTKTEAAVQLRIIVKYEAGLGDTIELRGAEKASLTWQSGKALICKGRDHWEIDLVMPDSVRSFEYKVTLRKSNGEELWEQLPKNGNRVFLGSSHLPEIVTPIFKA